MIIVLISLREIGSGFGSIGTGDCCESQLRYRVRRTGTSRARRNAYRNERLTRAGVEMPMEPRFERELANG